LNTLPDFWKKIIFNAGYARNPRKRHIYRPFPRHGVVTKDSKVAREETQGLVFFHLPGSGK
jgi:hypothetical protein